MRHAYRLMAIKDIVSDEELTPTEKVKKLSLYDITIANISAMRAKDGRSYEQMLELMVIYLALDSCYCHEHLIDLHCRTPVPNAVITEDNLSG